MYVDLTEAIKDVAFFEDFLNDLESSDSNHATKLCFADCFEDEETGEHYLKLWFTVTDMINQWGDDWSDYPCDSEAGEPYDSYLDENGTRVCYNIYTITLTLINRDDILMPCEYGNNWLSAAEINSGRAAWVYIRESQYRCDGIALQAGITLKEALDKLDGKIKDYRGNI